MQSDAEQQQPLSSSPPIDELSDDGSPLIEKQGQGQDEDRDRTCSYTEVKSNFSRRGRSNLLKWAPWIIHLTLIFAYLLVAVAISNGVVTVSYNGGLSKKVWPDIYDDFPQEHRTRQTLGAADTLSEFQGRPSEAVRRAWEELLSVGIVGITTSEASRLPLHAAQDVHHPGTYVVELDVFHQLHCLYMLRKQVWEPRHIAWQNDEEVGFWEFHIDHCIEHLRLTLMCNADTTPQRYLWDHERETYTLPSRQEFMCQDFEAIWDWAASRNTTGQSPTAVGGSDKADAVMEEA